MLVLILKARDGEVVNFQGREAAEIMEGYHITYFMLDAMKAGIPLTTPEGDYTIEEYE